MPANGSGQPACRRVRRAAEGFVAVFLSSLVLVVISIGFTPVWMVLAISGAIAAASIPAFYLYELASRHLHHRKQ
jgi:hypothetical protein